MKKVPDLTTVALDEETRTWIAQVRDCVGLEPDRLELLLAWVRQAATGMP